MSQGVDQEGCLPKTAWPPTLYGSIRFYNRAVEKCSTRIICLDIFYLNTKLLIFPTSNEGYKYLIKISSNVLQKKDFDLNVYLKDILIIFNDKK